MRGENRRIDAAKKRVEKLRLPEQTHKAFGRYREDPVGFVRDVWSAASATRRSDGEAYQFSVLADLVTAPRVAVLSGHGVGKTTLDAWAVIWWLVTRPMSRVIVVAPEFTRQVKAVLFAEIRKWVRRAREPLPLEVLASRVQVKGHGEEWGAIGIPATEPDRIEGFHSDGGLLLILDECKGIPQAVFDALQGALTGGEESRLLVTSTPGGEQGPFWRICTAGGGSWKIHRVSAEDSSNVAPAWCEEREREWGRDNPVFIARVLGQFASAGDGILFPLALIESSTNRDSVPEGLLTIGVDVARSLAGDLNCLAVARGGWLERLVTWRSADTMATVARVVNEANLLKPGRIIIDESGVGAGVLDRLRQLGFPAEGFNFGGAAMDPTRFRNRRAEAFFSLREAMEKGNVCLPDDDDLTADLSSLRYSFDQSGKILLESKDVVRARIGRSPDRGDAVALAIGSGIKRNSAWHFWKLGQPQSRMGHEQTYPSPYAI